MGDQWNHRSTRGINNGKFWGRGGGPTEHTYMMLKNCRILEDVYVGTWLSEHGVVSMVTGDEGIAFFPERNRG